MGFDVRMSYGEAVAFGIAKDAVRWYKIGYTPTMTTAVSDIWSAAGVATCALRGYLVSS